MKHCQIKIFIASFFISWNTFGQIIPANRVTDWSHAGSAPKFVTTNIIDITKYGADTTGILPSDNALRQAIAALQGQGEIRFLPGNYLFNQTIELPDSTIMSGAKDINGKLVTKLKLAINENHGFKINGGEFKSKVAILEPLVQGQTVIKISEQIFKKGDYIRLYAYDDSTLVFSSWAIHNTGQIVEITKTRGNAIYLNQPLRRSYAANRTPVIYKLIPRKHIHLQSLILETKNKSSWHASTIDINCAVDCSVSDVESFTGNYAHVAISYSDNITIENNYFKDAFSYGGGGAGYGVVLQYAASDCYIHSNMFEHLRHSILLQAGANGNVVAYNHSILPNWTGTFLPSNSAGDLVLHGNYSYMNLLEGNVMQNIVIDNSHGINGPYNTFFRNRAESYGVVMNNSPASNSQNFIGNQIVSTKTFMGNYIIQGTDQFQYGNMVKGIVLPAATTEPDANSLFNYSFSAFYYDKSQVPPIQNSNWQEEQPLIEAQYRYEFKDAMNTITALQKSDDHLIDKEEFKVFPNPVINDFVIKNYLGTDKHFKVYDAAGILVLEGGTNVKVDVENLHSGLYFVQIDGNSKQVYKIVKM